MKVNQKADYTSLFSQFANSDKTGTSSLLSDYASIKNGSYGKLLKSYYSTVNTDTKASKSTAAKKTKVEDDPVKKNLSSVKSSAEDLKKSASNLTASLFEGGDKEKIEKAVKEYADNYNKVVTAAGKDSNKSITKQASSMVSSTFSNRNMLSSVGITMNENFTLNVDTEKLSKASASTLKTLFSNPGSYGDNVEAKASMISNSANSAINSGRTYESNAKSNTSYIDSIFNTYN